MPYKPNWKVVRAESSDCRDDTERQSVKSHERALPDDLQAVADQLIDDAQHLESHYPARFATSVPAEFARSDHTAVWRRAAAAVLLVGIGAAGAMLAQHFISLRHAAVADPPAEHLTPLVAKTIDQSTPPNPGSVREVSFDRTAPRTKLTEVEMLRIQLDAFEKVIRKLQDELTERQKSEAQTNQLVELLRREIDDLRRQLDNGNQAPAR